jgi:hypothetical protein
MIDAMPVLLILLPNGEDVVIACGPPVRCTLDGDRIPPMMRLHDGRAAVCFSLLETLDEDADDSGAVACFDGDEVISLDTVYLAARTHAKRLGKACATTYVALYALLDEARLWSVAGTVNLTVGQGGPVADA